MFICMILNLDNTYRQQDRHRDGLGALEEREVVRNKSQRTKLLHADYSLIVSQSNETGHLQWRDNHIQRACGHIVR